MLRSEFPDAGEQSPETLLDAYETVLTETVESVGHESVVEATGLDPQLVAAVADGSAAELSLEDAAAVLATDPDRRDAEAIQADAQDILLLGMTTAVLDVEALASGLNSQLEPKEIQQKIEGRYPMTLREYAMLHSHIEQRKQ
jgi:hypothetical protein